MLFYNQRHNICRVFYSPPTVLHYNHLYGLGNNYIYNVNKDKIKGKEIGQTVYGVRYYFNEDAKETMQEKINRMLVIEVNQPEI